MLSVFALVIPDGVTSLSTSSADSYSSSPESRSAGGASATACCCFLAPRPRSHLNMTVTSARIFAAPRRGRDEPACLPEEGVDVGGEPSVVLEEEAVRG